MVCFDRFYRDGCGQLRVLSIKASLVTLCAGKFVDKLKCEFIFINFKTVVHFAQLLLLLISSSNKVLRDFIILTVNIGRSIGLHLSIDQMKLVPC